MSRGLGYVLAAGCALAGLFFYYEAHIFLFSTGCRTIGELLLGLPPSSSHRIVQSRLALAFVVLVVSVAVVHWVVHVARQHAATRTRNAR